MKTLLSISILIALAPLVARAGDSAQEKAFTDKYKTAFEAKDTATLQSFLYTTGADPGAVEFYKMMQSSEVGGKISSIQLVALSPEDAAKASAPQDAPTGGKVCLTLKPTKKLIISVDSKTPESTGTSKTENFVAEKDGKFLIPVPGPCK